MSLISRTVQKLAANGGKAVEKVAASLSAVGKPATLAGPSAQKQSPKLFVPQQKKLVLPTQQNRWMGGVAAAQGAAPSVRSAADLDAWANDKSNIIVPKWWNEKRPGWDVEKISIDASKLNLKDHMTYNADGTCSLDTESSVCKDLKARMEGVFDEQGVVYVRKTGFKTPAELKAVMELAEIESMIYEGGANLRPDAVDGAHVNVYETGAPRDAHIHYHHEMAYVKESCKWIGFMCLDGTNNPFKGASYISNQVNATAELMETELGNKLKEKGVCYIRKLPDLKYFEDNNLDKSIVYNFWQTSMLTHDQGEAEKVANKKGLEVEWEESPVFGRYMVTKFYIDTFEHCPHTDKNLLYASVADDYMWFDTWPGVVDLPHQERPLKLNFGDDSIMTREEKQQFVDVYDNHGMPIPWEQGDFALCCNFRTAHGRPAYNLDQGEKRELGVVLGNLYGRKGENPDKW